jgi:hypothetical protein
MVSQSAQEPPPIRRDGFGTRLVEQVPKLGRVERLRVSASLATAGSEQAIRARAAHLTRLGPGPVARVLRIERKGTAVSILSEMPDGVTLSDILAALEFKTFTLSDEEALELAALVVRAAGVMHETLGTLAHGALSPAHVVVTREGSIVFTGAVFGDAIRALRRDREQLWREFGLALPPSDSLPTFDQRGDVTQLGALVLAIGQRRWLARDEFPKRINDLVMATSIGSNAQTNSRLRTWLQNTLQVEGRVVFDSCIEPARKFNRVLPQGGNDEAEALALRAAILQLCGEPSNAPAASTWSSSVIAEFSYSSFA